MANRENRSIPLRLLSSVAAFAIIGTMIYIIIAGINVVAGVLLASAVIGLGIPSVSASDSIIGAIIDFFELLLDGVMEVIDGILDLLSSVSN